MASIHTVRGPLDAAQLGITLMHEHVFVLSTEVLQNYPDIWGDEEQRIADAAARLNELGARFPHIDGETFWLAATQQNRKDFDPPVITRRLASLHVIERGANVFPTRLRAPAPLLSGDEPHANLSTRAIKFLAALGLTPRRYSNML